MKKILLSALVLGLVLSCSTDEDDTAQTINLRIDHYKDTAMGLSPILTYREQTGESIGSEDWTLLYQNIEGFDYSLGTTYDLLVDVIPIDNPPADGSSVKFTLVEIQNEERASEDETFTIGLKKFDGEVFVTTTNDDYKLLNQIDIECNELCSELEEKLRTQDEVFGTFVHTFNNSLKLTGLE